MSVYVPTRDSDIDLGLWLQSHRLGVVFHPFSQILRPLTGNVVCYDDPQECNTKQSGEDDIVHVRIPVDWLSLNHSGLLYGNGATFPPFEDLQLRFCVQGHASSRAQDPPWKQHNRAWTVYLL